MKIAATLSLLLTAITGTFAGDYEKCHNRLPNAPDAVRRLCNGTRLMGKTLHMSETRLTLLPFALQTIPEATTS